MILDAQSNSKSASECARWLGVSFNTYKKWAQYYKVYDNVKNPLGFLCNKINYFSKKNQEYNLTDVEPVEFLSNDDINDILLENQSEETG